jgi:hypothetical protein
MGISEMVNAPVKPDSMLNAGTELLNGFALHMISNKVAHAQFFVVA